MHCICLWIYFCECLYPVRKTLNRIYSAAWKEKYNIQKSAEYAHNSWMISPSQKNKHHTQKGKRCKDYDDNYGYALVYPPVKRYSSNYHAHCKYYRGKDSCYRQTAYD